MISANNIEDLKELVSLGYFGDKQRRFFAQYCQFKKEKAGKVRIKYFSDNVGYIFLPKDFFSLNEAKKYLKENHAY
jgi:hypothetical protein